jgi:hypothetical protein
MPVGEGQRLVDHDDQILFAARVFEAKLGVASTPAAAR